MSRTTRLVPVLGLAVTLLLAGCVSEGLPQEGGQGAVTAGPAPDATAEQGPSEASGSASEEAAGASQECLDAVRAAEEQEGAGSSTAGASQPASADPTGGPSEESELLGQDEGPRPGVALFPAFEACGSVEEFRVAASEYRGALDGNDPADYVIVLCEREQAIEDSTLCASVGTDGGALTGSEAPADGSTTDG